MQPTLLVLAAGMGSRYGGLKQVDPVGPSGETILDYAVFDAIRAGFGRVVFVIRKEFEEAFRTQVAAKYADRVGVDYVFQSLDALPSGFTPPPAREKPWGTGHAVWCARDAVKEPFAVIGADDYFGRDAFEKLAIRLSESPKAAGGIPAFAMVGYRLANTLSENGAVSRGVCAATADGTLQCVVEHTGIRREEVGTGPDKKFTGEEIVSMNCWAFTPALFDALDRQFTEFLQAKGSELKSEFYLPEAVSRQIAAGKASVKVVPTTASWFGVTYREDKPRVQAALASLVASGEYPAQLFPAS
ncbi:MAG TPA: sugar phosphate nucleotidyltransferase [Rariglobus sp.]|jgi:NDP-sugar pyrophosphorylase family protein|nr:sugar phosphate nucleotidyltransferase [Rariglobus sp.]